MTVTDSGALGVGTEDHACEESDKKSAQGCDRIYSLTEKRGNYGDHGGNGEHIAAQQPAVEIAVLA